MNLQVEPFYKPDRNPYRSLKGTLFVDEDLEKLGARFKQCASNNVPHTAKAQSRDQVLEIETYSAREPTCALKSTPLSA